MCLLLGLALRLLIPNCLFNAISFSLSLFFIFFFALEANFPHPPEVKKKKTKKHPLFENIGQLSPPSSAACVERGLCSTTSFPSWVGLHDKLIHHLGFLNLAPLGWKTEATGSLLTGSLREPPQLPSAHCVRSFYRRLGGKDHRPSGPPQENRSGTTPRWRQSPIASGLEELGRGHAPLARWRHADARPRRLLPEARESGFRRERGDSGVGDGTHLDPELATGFSVLW